IGTTRRFDEIVDDGEEPIRKYVAGLLGGPLPAPNEFLEYDIAPNPPANALAQFSMAWRSLTAPDANWMLPSVARVFPAISRDHTLLEQGDAAYTASDFFNDRYARRRVTEPSTNNGAETVKAASRRISWTAFYRRIGYSRRTPGKDGLIGGLNSA